MPNGESSRCINCEYDAICKYKEEYNAAITDSKDLHYVLPTKGSLIAYYGNDLIRMSITCAFYKKAIVSPRTS